MLCEAENRSILPHRWKATRSSCIFLEIGRFLHIDKGYIHPIQQKYFKRNLETLSIGSLRVTADPGISCLRIRNGGSGVIFQQSGTLLGNLGQKKNSGNFT